MTVDLRNGSSRQPDPEDYMTKVTAVTAAEPNMSAPLWNTFLERITDGDDDLQAYLQRVAGYCLSGSVREHVLFFLYGTGANGKSVFVNTLLSIWNDYALTIGTEMLMVSHADRHPTEVARLRGVRLAVANEIESDAPGPSPRSRRSPAATGCRAASCAKTSLSSTRSSSS